MDVRKYLKKYVMLVLLCMLATIGKGQIMSAEKLLDLAGVAKPKLKSYLTKKSFRYTGKEQAGDTAYTFYQYVKVREKGDSTIDQSVRTINVADQKEDNCIIYQTSDTSEFHSLITDLIKQGFYCNQSLDSIETQPLIFQHNEYMVRSFFTQPDSVKLFCLSVAKKTFPNAKDIVYADDMLAFTSHEALVYYFGKNNVKSDVYFFSENEVNRCSVLFLNTRRQVVYIWKDDINKCGIDHLLFGGQQKLASISQQDNFVAENDWIFKSGVHAGMSLYELIKLNEEDFKFYGSNSANSGLILPDNTGKLNFKKENIVLGCVNCKDDPFSNATVINANDALSEEKILFVLTIALNPKSDSIP